MHTNDDNIPSARYSFVVEKKKKKSKDPKGYLLNHTNHGSTSVVLVPQYLGSVTTLHKTHGCET